MKNKVKSLNVKILKKLSARVQLRETNTGFIVERKSRDTGEWEIIARSARFKKILMKKHNAYYAELSRLNLTSQLMNKRKTRKMKLEKIKKRKLKK